MSPSAPPVVAPFCAIRYTHRAGDLSHLLAPPFDVISPREQEHLYQRDEHNIVRLELARSLPGDTDSDNCYTRAAATWRAWLEAGVVAPDRAPGLYPVRHSFTLEGKEYRRLGVFAAVRLADWEEGLVLPHEDTYAGPKADRLQLLRAVGAQISPVFGLYRGEGDVRRALAAMTATPPMVTAALGGERVELWQVTAPSAIAAFADVLGQGPVFIADGHHRYETALAFRNEMRRLHPQAPPSASFNWVLMLLVAVDDPGLVVLPAARLLRGVTLARVAQVAEPLFELHTVNLRPGEYGPRLASARQEGRVAFVAVSREGALLLALRPEFCLPDDPRGALDVSLLHQLVIDRLLPGQEEGTLAYEMGEEEPCRRVAAGDYDVAFFLNAPTSRQVIEVAQAGQRMPHKSTYFHPKPPTGLVMYGVGEHDRVG